MKSQLSYQSSREHRRFKANHRAMAIHPEGPEAIPYHVIDISKGGLSYRYLGKKIHPANAEKINLYCEHELIIASIPVVPVSDYRLRDNLVPVRRRSFRFGVLSREQQSQLEIFLQNYTEDSP